MNRAELFFHIARRDGFEFVFTSGNALRYPAHTHVSVHTITVVRKGVVRLARKSSTDVYPAGSVYTVAPHEPHSPEYADAFDIVSLCVDKNHFRRMTRSALAEKYLAYASRLVERNLLRADAVQGLLAGMEGIYDAAAAADKTSIIKSGLLEAWPCENAGPAVEARPGLSRFHFIRKFKREIGLTPHQYTVQSRIRNAKKLLTTATPIADVAVLAEFCDQSHLNRWFNRSLGITPSLYKNSCFFFDSE